MEYIVKPLPLNEFLSALDDLDQTKLFYIPRNVYCHEHQQGDRFALEKKLKQIDEECRVCKSECTFYVWQETKISYCVSTYNKLRDNFHPSVPDGSLD